MRSLITLAIGLTLTACGMDNGQLPHSVPVKSDLPVSNGSVKGLVVDSELSDFVNEFTATIGSASEVKAKMGQLDFIRFDTEGDAPELRSFSRALLGKSAQVLGRCYYPGAGRQGYIVVNRQAWDEMESGARRTLIFHELGHCALGLDHSTHRTEGKGLDPIMDASLSMFDEEAPSMHWPELIEDFVNYAAKEQGTKN